MRLVTSWAYDSTCHESTISTSSILLQIIVSCQSLFGHDSAEGQTGIMQRSNWIFVSALNGRVTGLPSVIRLASVRFGCLIVRQSSSELSQKAADPPRDPNVYETDRIVNQYMAFHYAEEDKYFRYDFGPKNHLGFPIRCARLCIEHMTVCQLVSRAFVCRSAKNVASGNGMGKELGTQTKHRAKMSH